MAISPETGQRLGREAIITKLKGLGKIRVTGVEINAHIERLKTESDRGVMILAATMVEDALVIALERRTIGVANSELRKQIYEYDGPLGSFSKRILFAQALAIIDKSYAQQMHTIREIRNVAAHAHVQIDFSVEEIRHALGSMLRPEQADDFETWPRPNVRNFYLQLCGYTADSLAGKLGSREGINGLYRAIKASDPSAFPSSFDK